MGSLRAQTALKAIRLLTRAACPSALRMLLRASKEAKGAEEVTSQYSEIDFAGVMPDRSSLLKTSTHKQF